MIFGGLPLLLSPHFDSEFAQLHQHLSLLYDDTNTIFCTIILTMSEVVVSDDNMLKNHYGILPLFGLGKLSCR